MSGVVHGRARIVRGPGSTRLTVTPRRARCGSCGRTQILLPTCLVLRRAARFDRPESTVRKCFRSAGERHSQWLYRRGVDRAVAIDRELLVTPAARRTTLGHALNMLIGAAHRYRQRLGLAGTLWSLVGIFAGGRLIPAGRPPRPS